MQALKNLDSIAQALVIVGASIFLFLGIVHAVLTLRDVNHPRTFTPKDPALRQAMQQSCIAIHPQTNLWRVWLGMNLSHSLGIILIGSVLIVMGSFYFSTYAQAPLIQGCAILVLTVYLILSFKFWFSHPTIGISIVLTCFVIASGLLISVSLSSYTASFISSP
jgi:hypothetical protein